MIHSDTNFPPHAFRYKGDSSPAYTPVPVAPIPPTIGQSATNIANMGIARPTRQVGRASTILTGTAPLQEQVKALLAQ